MSSIIIAPRKSESFLLNKRSQRLYTVSFGCSEGKAKAVLFFHHGLGEHSGRYDKVFSRLSQEGVIVIALDAHGHGKSEPLEAASRAYIGKFEWLVEDFYECIYMYKEAPELKALPRFIGGHSMGGLIAAHAALEQQGMWSGLLLHSPSLDVEWTYLTRVQAWVGRLLSYWVPAARVVTAVRPEDMSQDPAAVRAFLEDPLISKGNVCARTACVLLDAFNSLTPLSKNLTIPVYVGHGTNDRCTSLPASRRFIKNVSSKDVTLYEFPGGFHELLHGPEWQDATDRMVKWIVPRCS